MQGKGIADPGENNRSECTALAEEGDCWSECSGKCWSDAS